MVVKKQIQEEQALWNVSLERCVVKADLPKGVKASLITLIKEIELDGPVRWNWPNCGKLSDDTHHCHLKREGRHTLQCGRFWTGRSE